MIAAGEVVTALGHAGAFVAGFLAGAFVVIALLRNIDPSRQRRPRRHDSDRDDPARTVTPEDP